MAVADPMQLAVDLVPEPEPMPGRVIVRVDAAALNPLDYKIAVGSRGGREFPYTLGFDCVGYIQSVGEGVRDFAVGDRVMAMASIQDGGTAAELVSLPQSNLAHTPASLNAVNAAALPLAALTAHQALEHVDLEAGQRILIHAGAGGVGHLAIQLAKLRGAEVVATASPRNVELLRELGADVAIDYTSVSPREAAAGADVVLDTLGGTIALESLRGMSANGTLVSIVGTQNAPDALREGVTVTGLLVKPDGQQLQWLAERVVVGDLRTLIHSTAPLAEAAIQLTELRLHHTVGKRVLVVR
jgi:NADPH:quinone reductase-like Zn-dependent oxidoreductase